MTAKESLLIQKIREAFPDVKLPLRGIASWEDIPEGEDEAIRDSLKGRSWTSLAPDEILQLPICFLTYEALASLLPAFLIWAISPENERRLDRIGEMQLTPYWKTNHRKRLARLLTTEQLSVLVEFLLHWSEESLSAQEALPFWLESLEKRKSRK